MLGFNGIISFDRKKFNFYKTIFTNKTKENTIFVADDRLSDKKEYILDVFSNGKLLKNYEDENILIVISGSIYDDPSDHMEENNYKWIANSYNKDFKSLAQLNGSYAIFIHDKIEEKFYILTDKNSVIPIYYSFKRNYLCFSWDISCVLRWLGSCDLDYENIFSWMLVGGRGFNESTRFKKIKRLNPGGILEIDKEKFILHESKLFCYLSGNEKIDDLIDGFVDGLKQSIKIRTENYESVCLGISGGLDSRIVLSALNDSFDGDINCFTYGPDLFNEKTIANQVTSTIGINNVNISFPDDIYLNFYNDGIYYSGGASMFKHGIQIHMYHSLKNYFSTNGLIQGSALDLVLGSSFSNENIVGIKNKNDLVEYYIKHFFNYSRNSFVNLFKDRNIGEHYYDYSVELVKNSLKKIDGDFAVDWNDAFSFEYRIKRWYNYNLIYPLYSFDLLLPTYDNYLIKLISKIPWRERLFSSFRIKILERMNKTFSQINYNKTMQPAWLKPPYGQIFNEYQNRLEQEKLKLWFKSNKNVYLPSNRYDSNFLEWFRVYPEYYNFAKQILNSNAILCKEYLKSSKLQAMINNHYSGDSESHKNLQMLISTEILHQLVSDGWENYNVKLKDMTSYIKP